MDVLPQLGGVMPALGIAVVIAIMGLKLKMTAEPGFLYTKLIPFFSALSQSRFLGPFKQLLYPLKVSAYIVFLMLQYTAYIPIRLMKGSFRIFRTVIGSLFFSTCNLMPELVQQRILAIDDYLANNYWIWDQRFAALIFQGLFPFWNNGPATALFSLADHINHAAERSRRNAVLRDILDSYEDVYLSNKACSTRFLGSDRKAEVQMVSTSLGVLDVLNAVTGEPSGKNVPPIEEESRSTEEPAKSVFMEGIEELLDEPAYRHWMIDIPDRHMAWHLFRNPEGTNTTIEHKEFVQELTTAAIGVKLTNGQKMSVGSTYVSNLFLIKVREIEGKLSIFQKKI